MFIGLGLCLKLFCKILELRVSIDRALLSIDRALQFCTANFCIQLDSNYNKKTLSKSKPRLIILIMVCQHIQNEVLIHLVPKVLEPNKLPLWQSVTKHNS